MRLSAILALISSSALFAQAPTIGGCPVFPADNIWNTPVDTLPVHPNSAAFVNSVGLTSYMHPDFSAKSTIGIPYIPVTGSQTKYPVYFHYASESDPGPYPVPLNAPIQEGANSTGDRHVIAVDTTNCKIYEMYRGFPGTSSWTAVSGAVFDMRSHALRPLYWTPADAAGLSILAGLVRYEEVAAGEIRHAIRVTAPQTRKAFVWPARHYASLLTDTRLPAMGQRFRLKANFDITPFPREVQVILRALKKYGMILSDNGAPWFISGVPDSRWIPDNLLKLRQLTGQNFEAVDVSPLMIHPDSGQARQLAVSVKLSPSTTSVITQGTLQFAATVQNSTNQSVTWTVNGIAGGNSQVGYISNSGTYSAPSAVPSPATVQVQAKSAASPSATASASVTITPPPSTSCTYVVSPTMVTMKAAGGVGSVTVTASSSSCQWTAATGFSWGLTLIGSASRTGSAVLQYQFAPNTGGPRSGYVRIAGKSAQFYQFGN